MKVAVSLPDPVFQAAEVMARKLKKSRSELYADAIAQYIGQRSSKAVTAKLNEVYSKEASQPDSVLLNAQFLNLARETW